MKTYLRIILLLLPLPLNANLDTFALEKLYEFIVLNFEEVDGLSIEESGIILEQDTFNIEVDLFDLFDTFDDRHLEGLVKVKINNEIKDALTMRISGRGSDKEDTSNDFIQNWLSDFGFCISKYLLNSDLGIKWKEYVVYVNKNGTTLENPIGFIDGSENMHIQILEQLEFGIEELLVKGLLTIKISVRNQAQTQSNSVGIISEKETRISVSANGQPSAELAKDLKYINWPGDKDYFFKRTYLIRLND